MELALAQPSLRLSVSVSLSHLSLVSAASPGGRDKLPMGLRGTAAATVEGVGDLPMTIGMHEGMERDAAYGDIEVYSREAVLSLGLSVQEIAALIDARLSARQFGIELMVLGLAKERFDELDIAKLWRVKSYALSINEITLPSPQGRGGESE